MPYKGSKVSTTFRQGNMAYGGKGGDKMKSGSKRASKRGMSKY
jgi:hypothetical protein